MNRENPFAKTVRFVKYNAVRQPGRSLLWFCIVSSLLWALQSALQKNILPQDAVESVCWGAKYQFGYFKHPFLAAWIAHLTARFTGYCDFFQYLLDSVCTVTGVWFIYKLAREFFDETRSAVAALLLFCLHYYLPPLMVFCPNSVQFLLQPLMAYLFIRAVKYGKWYTWSLFGFFSGLAFVGKYSAALLLICMAAGVVFHPEARKRILSIGPWLAAVIFGLVILPHLLWLYQHDFICLTYVSSSLGNSDAWPPAVYALFILGTGLYPLVHETAMLLILCLPKHFRRAPFPADKEALYWSLFCTVPPVILYAGLALSGEHVVAMWLATIASFTGILTVCLFPFRITKLTFYRLFLLICAVSVIALIATSIDLDVRTRERIHLKPQVLFGNVEKYMNKYYPGQKVACLIGKRDLVNTYEYYHPDHPASFDLDDPVLIRENQARFDREGVLFLSDYSKTLFPVMEQVRPGSSGQFIKKELPGLEILLESRAPHGKTVRTKEDNPLVLIYIPPLKK